MIGRDDLILPEQRQWTWWKVICFMVFGESLSFHEVFLQCLLVIRWVFRDSRDCHTCFFFCMSNMVSFFTFFSFMTRSMFSLHFQSVLTVLWRELFDCCNFPMWLWVNSRLEQRPFISLWRVTSKSRFFVKGLWYTDLNFCCQQITGVCGWCLFVFVLGVIHFAVAVLVINECF